jgi:hypothetical protein
VIHNESYRRIIKWQPGDLRETHGFLSLPHDKFSVVHSEYKSVTQAKRTSLLLIVSRA